VVLDFCKNLSYQFNVEGGTPGRKIRSTKSETNSNASNPDDFVKNQISHGKVKSSSCKARIDFACGEIRPAANWQLSAQRKKTPQADGNRLKAASIRECGSGRWTFYEAVKS
jgi:hypothetical protein